MLEALLFLTMGWLMHIWGYHTGRRGLGETFKLKGELVTGALLVQ